MTVTWVVLAGIPAAGMAVRYAGAHESRAREVAEALQKKYQTELARLNAQRQVAKLPVFSRLHDEVHLQQWLEESTGLPGLASDVQADVVQVWVAGPEAS